MSEFAVTVYDPFSTLIGKEVRLGAGTQIYPNCSILCGSSASVALGKDNLLYPSTIIQAQSGAIRIGNGNRFGPGGFVASTVTGEDILSIGDHGRYTDGAGIYGKCVLGSGSQVLGQIAVNSCELGVGGDFREPDPDKRGGVLKGLGRAKALHVGCGEVIQAYGEFAQCAIERQIDHHPPHD
ncbi:MAG: hypothetical protein ACTSX7_01385 [Alphaproteobacteria bacterium]